MPKIAIVGPGAIGSVLAAILHAAHRHELLLCVRRPRSHPELVVDHEATSVTPSATTRFSPRIATSPSEAAPVDWIFVTTKTYDAASAAAWLGPLGAGDPGTRVAVIQNGVEHRERFA